MYANIYQIRTNKYKFDKNNYISTLNQKTNYQDKPMINTYINKRQNSTKYLSQPQMKQQYINYDLQKNSESKTKPQSNRRINSSM
jgi:hypothetical protein